MSEQKSTDLSFDTFAFIHASQTRDNGMAVNLLNETMEKNAKLEIELEMIRAQVADLLHGEYMPMPHTVMGALYVDEDAIEKIYEERKR